MVRLDAKITHELSKTDSNIPFRYTRNHIHHTWAKTFYSLPELYLQPHSTAEIQKIVTLARRCRRRLVTVGCGHSPSDLTCTSSWMVNLDNFNRLLYVDHESGIIRFESGITIHDLNSELAKHKLTMPNLGSIDNQSVAGAISTGTHGSSLHHGLLSQNITALTLVLANSQVVRCSSTTNPQLFRAALLSLGALGIITEITFKAVPDYNISWTQTLHPLSEILDTWESTLWSEAEFTRVWWMPYMKRAARWHGHTASPEEPVRKPRASYYGGKIGYYTYHNLLTLSNYLPRILPWIEWFIFGMQWGFRPGTVTTTAVEPAREGLLMDCLYSQFVNEWALPLSKGPEAITRLSAWINGEPEAVHRIPVSSREIWVHCPIEVRCTDTSEEKNDSNVRPYLDQTYDKGPTLYLNATLYRPYGRDPPCRERYYEAFEYLMRELGAKPHWAKNFREEGAGEIARLYGENMQEFMKVRNESDPDGIFLGGWHRRVLPLAEKDQLGEREVDRTKSRRTWGDGLVWRGSKIRVGGDGEEGDAIMEENDGSSSGSASDQSSPSPSPEGTATSEESFDYLAKGEASVHGDKSISFMNK